MKWNNTDKNNNTTLQLRIMYESSCIYVSFLLPLLHNNNIDCVIIYYYYYNTTTYNNIHHALFGARRRPENITFRRNAFY